MPINRKQTPGMASRSHSAVISRRGSSFDGANRFHIGSRQDNEVGYDTLPGLECEQDFMNLKQFKNTYEEQLAGNWSNYNPGKLMQEIHYTAGAPVLRLGKGGSSWRHLKETRGYAGNPIMFLDGAVKSRDCDRYPPAGYPPDDSDTVVHAGDFKFRCSARPRKHLVAPLNRPRCSISHSLPAIYSQAPFGAQPLTLSRNFTIIREQPETNGSKSGRPKYDFKNNFSRKSLIPTTIQGRIMKSGVAY